MGQWKGQWKGQKEIKRDKGQRDTDCIETERQRERKADRLGGERVRHWEEGQLRLFTLILAKSSSTSCSSHTV